MAMGVTFQKGDEIALTGSKVKQGEADPVLAREVVRGSDTAVLRDPKGSPIGSWHKWRDLSPLYRFLRIL